MATFEEGELGTTQETQRGGPVHPHLTPLERFPICTSCTLFSLGPRGKGGHDTFLTNGGNTCFTRFSGPEERKRGPAAFTGIVVVTVRTHDVSDEGRWPTHAEVA